MKNRARMALAAGLIIAAAVGEVTAAQVSDFDAALFRTRRGQDLTVVDGLLEFDPRIVEGGDECAYLVSIGVSDSSRMPVLTDRWRGLLACDPEETARLEKRHARVVETFRFGIAPGRYSLEVSVEPAGRPELARKMNFEVRGLSQDALASDLILARDVSWVDSTAATTWTIRRGELGIAADPYPVTHPDQPDLSYYLEVYSRPGASLQCHVQGVIRRPNGDEVASVALAELDVTEDRPVAGAIPLSGLPPGDYALEIRLQFSDTLVTRSAPFRMARPDLLLADASSIAIRREEASLEAYFWSLSDEELEELFDPIEVWLGTQKERAFFADLSADGRRRFLARYFAEAASTMFEGEESPLDVYLQRVRYVNATYAEKAGQTAQAGWRTDRGRIYLKRGIPDERLERPYPRGSLTPYEIWAYNISPRFVYLFVDETRFQNYRLIFSTDPSEPALMDWQRRAGESAVDALVSYFGIRARFPTSER